MTEGEILRTRSGRPSSDEYPYIPDDFLLPADPLTVQHGFAEGIGEGIFTILTLPLCEVTGMRYERMSAIDREPE